MGWPEFNLYFWGFQTVLMYEQIVMLDCFKLCEVLKCTTLNWFLISTFNHQAESSYCVTGPGGAGCIQRRAGQPSQHLQVWEQPQGETSAGKTISQIPGIWWSLRTLDWMTVNYWLLLKGLVLCLLNFFLVCMCAWLNSECTTLLMAELKYDCTCIIMLRC